MQVTNWEDGIMKKVAVLWFLLVPVVCAVFILFKNYLTSIADLEMSPLFNLLALLLWIPLGTLLASGVWIISHISFRLQVLISVFWVLVIPAIYIALFSGVLIIQDKTLYTIFSEINLAALVVGGYGFTLIHGILKYFSM